MRRTRSRRTSPKCRERAPGPRPKGPRLPLPRPPTRVQLRSKNSPEAASELFGRADSAQQPAGKPRIAFSLLGDAGGPFGRPALPDLRSTVLPLPEFPGPSVAGGDLPGSDAAKSGERAADGGGGRAGAGFALQEPAGGVWDCEHAGGLFRGFDRDEAGRRQPDHASPAGVLLLHPAPVPLLDYGARAAAPPAAVRLAALAGSGTPERAGGRGAVSFPRQAQGDSLE